jgi:hypothetical protein
MHLRDHKGCMLWLLVHFPLLEAMLPNMPHSFIPKLFQHQYITVIIQGHSRVFVEYLQSEIVKPEILQPNNSTRQLHGLWVGYRWVRVWVDLLPPIQNPYPTCRYHRYWHPSCCYTLSCRMTLFLVPFPPFNPCSHSFCCAAIKVQLIRLMQPT